MAQYSNALARRTGTAAVRNSGTSSGSGWFESAKDIPGRLFTETARTPVMFGALAGGAGWYGNEPEAKMGAASMHSKSFGSLAEEYEYLGSMNRGNTTTLLLIAAAAYAFLS